MNKLYILLDFIENRYIITDKIYKSKNALKAAKKAFRNNKNLEFIYLLEKETCLVYVYNTSSFFTIKKPFKIKRENKYIDSL